MQELAGRTALVTGGSHGIGAAIGRELRRRGATVYVADVAAEGSGDPFALPCDVTDPAAVRRTFEAVETRAAPVDILVCNAGLYPAAPFEAISLEEWRRVFAVNVEGTFLCCQAALPGMRERRWGRIVALGSNTFHMGWPMLAHYVASKGAITGLVRTLATEYGPFGVTANVVSPTLTETEGTRALFAAAPAAVEAVVARQAIPRAGQPDDVAGVVALLCTDAARFVTGQTIAADGGLAKL